MKIQKWYNRLQYSNGKHQLVRVDNIPEVKEILNSDEFKIWKKALEKRVELSVISGTKIKDVEPYTVSIEEEKFLLIQKEINRKLNIVEKYEFGEFNLVFNSKNAPIIKIKRLCSEKKTD